MQIAEEVASKHGLVALLQEKLGRRGSSGKQQLVHLTLCGAQLLNPGDLTQSPVTPRFSPS